MIEKTITYIDYEGAERTETFHFNISKAEALEMQLAKDGGLARLLETIVATKDQPKIIAMFKDFILRSYGEKSADGRRFIKSKEITESFVQTEAYSILFMELATNAESAAKFVNGVMPADLGLEDHLAPAKKKTKAELTE